MQAETEHVKTTKTKEEATDGRNPPTRRDMVADKEDSSWLEYAGSSPWADTILEKITTLTSPFTEHFEKQQTPEPADASEWTGTIAKRVTTFASPIMDPWQPKATEENDSKSSWRKSMTNKMAVLASPLTDRFDVHGTLDSLNMKDIPNEMLAGALCVFLLLVLAIQRFLRKREPAPPRRRARTVSYDSLPVNRTRSVSSERPRGASRDRINTEEGIFQVSATAEKSVLPKSVFGPKVTSIVHETWTPPIKWADASRQLLPQRTKELAKGKLILNVQDGILSSHRAGNRLKLPIVELSIHVKSPPAGGVLELYVKESPKEDWMEHTFVSACAAAQFQHDLISYQVVGESIRNMYEALELIQKGSLAHDGKECVLHDITADDKKAAVAWDDAMRCFSGMPLVRVALDKALMERDFVHEKEGSNEPALAEQYLNKRLLLGYVDFFRLFVTKLERTALPETDSHPARVQELLELRKLVAQAAVMVQSYVHARTVANKGWNLGPNMPDQSLVKRLAYDDNSDNMEWDSTAKNEYYEGTVSRDVRCEVHSAQHLKRSGSSTLSQYQAYSLVSSHAFKLPPLGQDHPLTHISDPVAALPSLRRLVEAHPELDFFICAFFPEGPRIAIIHVFVRSLPKGVDAAFDTVIDRFVNGTFEVRQRKLEVFIQLGPGAALSPLAWAALKTFSLLLSWTRKGEAQIPFESEADNKSTSFPGMTMSNYMDTTHFGGSLQTDPSLPKNYVAVTSHVDASKMNLAARALYQRLEEGALPASITDFTFVLEGQEADELPERSIGSVRMVHVDPVKVALPTFYSGDQDVFASTSPRSSTMDAVDENVMARLLAGWHAWNPFSHISETLSERQGSPLAHHPSNEAGEQNGLPLSQQEVQRNRADPFQAGVDALCDILNGVTVPVRRENLSANEISIADNMLRDGPPSQFMPKEDMVNVPVLMRTSTDDLRRYFVAAKCDLKEAAVRVVESAAWRGITFPIDTHQCRIELQSGQFFQQGEDLSGNPVFYFQTLIRGPWRNDVDATVAAILHRLESALVRMSQEKPGVKCTVIAFMGRPPSTRKRRKKGQERENDNASAVESTDVTLDEEESIADDTSDRGKAWNPFRMGVNPRSNSGEVYQIHCSTKLIERLADVLLSNYPERLNKLLLVPGKGAPRSSAGGTYGIRKSKVMRLSKPSELAAHVSRRELVTIAGGMAEVHLDAFEAE